MRRPTLAGPGGRPEARSWGRPGTQAAGPGAAGRGPVRPGPPGAARMPSAAPEEAVPRGAWALWADVPAPARRELRGYYKDLRRRYGARTALERAALKILAELLFATATAWAASAAA